MKCELLIANKRSGKVWDVVNCTQTASWTTTPSLWPGKTVTWGSSPRDQIPTAPRWGRSPP